MGEKKERRDNKREIAMEHMDGVAEGTLATPQERGFEECPYFEVSGPWAPLLGCLWIQAMIKLAETLRLG